MLIVLNDELGTLTVNKLMEEYETSNNQTNRVTPSYYVVDLSNLFMVQQFVKDMPYDRCDYLINAAASIMCENGLTELNKTNMEKQFCINYLSHYLLTTLLARTIIKCSGRVINFASNDQLS